MNAKDKSLVGGVFHVEHRRNGKVIHEQDVHNLVVYEGLTHILSQIFQGGSNQVATWYLGIFESNYTQANDDAASNITSRSVECTAYDETTRQEWVDGTIGTGPITLDNSASRASFTMNATKTVYGCFLVSVATKSATTGVLMSTAKFTSARSVISGDELVVTYTLTAADA